MVTGPLLWAPYDTNHSACNLSGTTRSAGVTTSELIALRGKDLKRVDRTVLEVGVAWLASDNSISLQLDVLVGLGSVGRTLRISERYSYLLLEWLGFRRVLLSEWTARVAEMEEGGAGLQSVDLLRLPARVVKALS